MRVIVSFRTVENMSAWSMESEEWIKPFGQEIVRVDERTLIWTFVCPKDWSSHSPGQCFKGPGVSYKWHILGGGFNGEL